MKAKNENQKSRWDAAMTLALLFLMGYQFWGEALHEWVGVGNIRGVYRASHPQISAGIDAFFTADTRQCVSFSYASIC
jgi:hypothetical protein